jgi:hypothetical protein
VPSNDVDVFLIVNVIDLKIIRKWFPFRIYQVTIIVVITFIDFNGFRYPSTFLTSVIAFIATFALTMNSHSQHTT